jgi:hypothetical protein
MIGVGMRSAKADVPCAARCCPSTASPSKECTSEEHARYGSITLLLQLLLTSTHTNLAPLNTLSSLPLHSFYPMPPRPSHKRAAESRTPSDAAPKKTRFAEPAEDPARFEEEVEASLEDSARVKRKVKSTGYDSDSSDDGESVVRSRAGGTGGAGTAQDDEDDDMFAIGEKEPEDEAKGGGKKKEEFLRLGDIEGQEFNDAEGGDESDESDEPEDEDDAARRAKAGMGYELSSFNMREEMEEGKFTEDGSYVRSFDAHAQHDKWMDGIDDREMKRARKRKRDRERQEKERQQAEERELADAGGKPTLERDLLAMLKRGETVLEAIQRLGAQAKRAQKLEKGYVRMHLLRPRCTHADHQEEQARSKSGYTQRREDGKTVQPDRPRYAHGVDAHVAR